MAVKDLTLPFKPRSPLPKNSAYGLRPLYGDMHTGVDFNSYTNAPANAAVHAAGDGVVIESYNGNTPGQTSWAKLRGTMVVIDHGLDRDGVRWKTRYHMLVPGSNIKKGSRVKRGTVIGRVGSSGSSTTGPHLHFELHRNNAPVDPMKYLRYTGIPMLTDDAATPFPPTQPLPTPLKGNDMLMVHLPAGAAGNPNKTQKLYAISGPAYWNEFVGDEVANGFARQIGANSVQVTKSFWDHMKKAANAGMPKAA